MSCYVSPSAGICFTGNGLRSTWLRVLTGVCSYFHLFEPCITGTDERQSILHQGEGDAKWSVWVRRLPFLVETSARGEIWWTERTTPNEANGPNRKSLAGLDMEKMRGEHAPPWTSDVAQMDHGSRKFWDCIFFHRELLVQVSDFFCNVKSPSGTLLSKGNSDFC